MKQEKIITKKIDNSTIILGILDVFASYVFNIEYDMGGWKSYRQEIGVTPDDDYPKSREYFVKLLKKAQA